MIHLAQDSPVGYTAGSGNCVLGLMIPTNQILLCIECAMARHQPAKYVDIIQV